MKLSLHVTALKVTPAFEKAIKDASKSLGISKSEFMRRAIDYGFKPACEALRNEAQDREARMRCGEGE